MKATINGTTIEGTPQEIAEYQRIMEERQRNSFKPTFGKPTEPASNQTTKLLTEGANAYGAMAVVSMTDLFKAAHNNSEK